MKTTTQGLMESKMQRGRCRGAIVGKRLFTPEGRFQMVRCVNRGDLINGVIMENRLRMCMRTRVFCTKKIRFCAA